MPSLLRFLAVIAVIGGIVYGAMFALAYMVEPVSRDMSVTIPQDRFYRGN